MYAKFSLLWHVRLPPLGVGDPKIAYHPRWLLPAKSGSRTPMGMASRLFRYPYVLNRVEIFARALHVQYASLVNYSHGASKAS